MRKFVDDATIQNSFMQALEIVEKVGIRFESEVVRALFKKRGARVEDLPERSAAQKKLLQPYLPSHCQY